MVADRESVYGSGSMEPDENTMPRGEVLQGRHGSFRKRESERPGKCARQKVVSPRTFSP